MLLALAARSASACTFASWLGMSSRPEGLFFVGQPLADTVFAGPGSIRYSLAGGHFGPPTRRPIHGQIVSVEKLEAEVSGELRTAVEAAGRRVALVPWDFDASCNPVPWSGSARWLDAEHALFNGELRAREHWVDGIPTLDVFKPHLAVYPALILQGSGYAYGAAPLGPLEMLGLVEIMLPHDEAEEDPDQALAKLEEWRRAHSALAGRFPANQALDDARRQVERARYLARDIPLAGTYRFVVAVGEDSAVVYVRTQDRADHEIEFLSAEEWRLYNDGLTAWRPRGVNVAACAAASEAGLPEICEIARGIRFGYVAFADSTYRTADGSEHRLGGLDFWPSGSPTEAVAALERRAAALEAALPARNDAVEMWVRGVFTLHSDGRITYYEATERSGTIVKRIRGERISTRTSRR